ncbi:hypothetical protein RND71_020904 [Anisodus tanguticus]|uniref:Uncharacterized protein n=1 Tax=Anisodus tanguticus TaxID=243964 RepID=A0AAE1VFM8_9SOLA|nr:hypothetical protein RND71_020904 [Anisodus tanguticus]
MGSTRRTTSPGLRGGGGQGQRHLIPLPCLEGQRTVYTAKWPKMAMEKTTSTTRVQCHQDSLMNPMHCHPPLKDNIPMFGVASCSSSDGSCSQMSFGKEIKLEENIGDYLLQGQIISSDAAEENQNVILDLGNNYNYCGNDHASTWADQSLDDKRGELKIQLEACSVSSNPGGSNLLSSG